MITRIKGNRKEDAPSLSPSSILLSYFSSSSLPICMIGKKEEWLETMGLNFLFFFSGKLIWSTGDFLRSVSSESSLCWSPCASFSVLCRFCVLGWFWFMVSVRFLGKFRYLLILVFFPPFPLGMLFVGYCFNCGYVRSKEVVMSFDVSLSWYLYNFFGKTDSVLGKYVHVVFPVCAVVCLLLGAC